MWGSARGGGEPSGERAVKDSPCGKRREGWGGLRQTTFSALPFGFTRPSGRAGEEDWWEGRNKQPGVEGIEVGGFWWRSGVWDIC